MPYARLFDCSPRRPGFAAGAQRFAHGLWVAAAAAMMLAGCSGGSGPTVQQNPAKGGTGTSVSDYKGPPPDTADVQSFKLNLWDNIRGKDRCGACHSPDGGQTPMFARSDDVNLAYAAANGVVTLTSPKDSRMVAKVAGGHNCWLASNQACADILTTWITNWAGATANGGSQKIKLEAPPIKDPGQSRSYPADPSLYGTTVYPLVWKHCSKCHSSSSAIMQQPFFAEGPNGDPTAIATAYEAAKPKMNLDDPASSRFVVRLRDESHNCWSDSCANDAAQMQAAIEAFAQGVPLTQVNPNLVTSKALTLYDGTIASGGNRYEANVIAKYQFKAEKGLTAFDTSGVDPAMDLTLSGNVTWVGGWGLKFAGGKAQASTASSAKLKKLIGATGEYTIEAWIAPGNVVQQNSRIVSYSAGTMARNFDLGQNMYDYDFFNRSSNSDANGSPALSTPAADQVLQATLQHVVATFDPVNGRKIYVNGKLVADQDPTPGGALSDWDDTFAFVLGNEVSGDKSFNGVVRFVAIHNRALTPAQVEQNYKAGVGEKYFLLFNVADLTNVPQSYVVFEASVYDSYSYLFRTPFFISLDPNAQPSGILIKGIRIAVNGAEAPGGQAFAHVNTVIDANKYNATSGQPLSNLGTVIPLEKGPDSDEFFLTFDQIGNKTYNRPPPATPPAPTPEDSPPVSDIGVRTFDAINATMATITGVSEQNPDVEATYQSVRESLPAVPDIQTFLASHQVAIAQLAIEYCNALVEDPTLRSQVFGNFPWNSPPSALFPGQEAALYGPLLDRMLGAPQIGTQPDRTAVETELNHLIDGIPGDPTRPGLANRGPDTAARTQDIGKAVCSAMLGSAAMLVD